jgi:hypothetical protein
VRDTLRITLALVALLNALPLCSQELPPAKSKVVPALNQEEIQAINEPRDRAQEELFAVYHGDKLDPDITTSIAAQQDLIAIVRVTAVNRPDGRGGSPYPKVTLHVQEWLRGSSKQTELYAEPRWIPPRPPNPNDPLDGMMFGGPGKTAFDWAEPKVGNRYVVGYSTPNEADSSAFISGALDFNDQEELARMLPEVKRFIDIDKRARRSSFAPYLEALTDRVPWIRDLAAQRPVQSDACNASAVCGEAFVTAAAALLRGKELGDRWEALKWLEPLAQAVGENQAGPNGLPLFSNAAARELLVAATSDPNLWIGDKAFTELALFDFYHSARAGECIEIVPAMRKSARWTAGEAKDASIGSPLGGTFACTAEPPPSLSGPDGN